MAFGDRRHTVTASVGGVQIGSGHPVVVQSMTNTDTADAVWHGRSGRRARDRRLAARARHGQQRGGGRRGSGDRRAPGGPRRRRARSSATFTTTGTSCSRKYPECARALAKYRINPGNVGSKRRDENFRAIVTVALEHDKPVRIGVNWGSLDQDLAHDDDGRERRARRRRVDAKDVYIEAMIESALRSAALAEEVGLGHDRILISAKVSTVQDLVDVYRRLGAPLRLPASPRVSPRPGLGMKGIVASTAALSILLAEGIGDTIRVSLTPRPNGDRTEEVHVAQQILQSLGLRSFAPQVTACPGCGRTTSTFFQQMAEDIQTYLREQMPVWRERHPGVEEMRVAVMGCVVNGPGESKHANIGISLPGTFEEPKAPVYVDGKLDDDAARRGESFRSSWQILEQYVARRYPTARASRRCLTTRRRPMPSVVRGGRVVAMRSAARSSGDSRVLRRPGLASASLARIPTPRAMRATSSSSRMIGASKPSSRKPVVHATVPAYGALAPDVEPAPDRLGIVGSLEIRENGARVMHLVRRADPARAIVRRSPGARGSRPSAPRTTARCLRRRTCGASPRGRSSSTSWPNLSAMPALEHVARESIAHAVLDHVVQNAGDDGVLILPVARQDDRDVRGMREVGKARSFAHLLIVVLGRERERVIDAIRVAGAHHDGALWARRTSNARIDNIARVPIIGQTMSR